VGRVGSCSLTTRHGVSRFSCLLRREDDVLLQRTARWVCCVLCRSLHRRTSSVRRSAVATPFFSFPGAVSTVKSRRGVVYLHDVLVSMLLEYHRTRTVLRLCVVGSLFVVWWCCDRGVVIVVVMW